MAVNSEEIQSTEEAASMEEAMLVDGTETSAVSEEVTEVATEETSAKLEGSGSGGENEEDKTPTVSTEGQDTAAGTKPVTAKVKTAKEDSEHDDSLIVDVDEANINFDQDIMGDGKEQDKSAGAREKIEEDKAKNETEAGQTTEAATPQEESAPTDATSSEKKDPASSTDNTSGAESATNRVESKPESKDTKETTSQKSDSKPTERLVCSGQ